ncbi:hypothetical protein WAI453_009357 [Rhynchosporium graminicola]
MCHQLIHMFKCAHQREPTIVRCKAPDSDCETPFLEPRMKSVKRSCERCAQAAAKRRAEKAQAERAARATKTVDEGYWS